MRAEIPRPLSSRRRPGPPFPALCHAGSNQAPPLMPEREKSLPGSHFVAHHPLERALNRRARNAPASKCPRLQKCARLTLTRPFDSRLTLATVPA